MEKYLVGVFFMITTFILLVIFVGFAEVHNIESCTTGNVSGFWMGLWHGWSSPITFFVSLFKDDVTIYDVNNNGNWYNFGFVVGSGILVNIISSDRN